MSEEESKTDEDGRIPAGPAQAAQRGPVLPVMTLEKNLVKLEEVIVSIFFFCLF